MPSSRCANDGVVADDYMRFGADGSRGRSEGHAWAASAILAGQVFPPFLVAGLGMVAAGLLLGRVVHTCLVFNEVREIVVLVPALLGLKGNLEMTLASRLSTHANLGILDNRRQRMSIIAGNLLAVQCQAIVVGLLASLVAITTNFFSNGVWNPDHAWLLSSSAVGAASIASWVLSLVMIAIVMASKGCRINPDNIASPIAGMLGDFCTLALLSGFAEALWTTREEFTGLQQGIVVFYIFMLAPACAWGAYRNPHTLTVIREGWMPVILSMLVSSVGGIILKHAVNTYHTLAPFAPVMNGAGGNLAAVHTSRLCTDLHSAGGDDSSLLDADGERPTTRCCNEAKSEKLDTLPSSQAARILVSLVVPGSICFTFLIVGVKSGWRALPGHHFVLVFMIASLIQACVLIVAADILVPRLWRLGIDPDNAAIPCVTSLGDIIGSTVLWVAFVALGIFGSQPWHGCCM